MAPAPDCCCRPGVLGLLGLCIGSFLNVVIYRLPLMLERQWWGDVGHQLADGESWRRVFGAPAARAAAPRQPGCEGARRAAPLGLARPRFALPVLRPRASAGTRTCRCSAGCGCAAAARPAARRISLRYPLVELLTGALFAAIGWRFGAAAGTACCGALSPPCWSRWRRSTGTPRCCPTPHAAAAVGRPDRRRAGLDDRRSPQALWGAVAGYLSLWSVYWLFKLATGKEGMGYGDFKLLAALGAWLGWQAIVPILLMASVIGAVVGIG